MDYLSEMTEYEYLMSNIEYPQIVLITDIDGNYLR